MKLRLSVRHRIVLLALLINALCYTDRVCIAILGGEIRRTFGFNQAQMRLVYSIPAGSPSAKLAGPFWRRCRTNEGRSDNSLLTGETAHASYTDTVTWRFGSSKDHGVA